MSSGWFSLWKKEERNSWLAKFVRMNEFKDQVCSSWFAPVGSANDYPFLSKWVIYGEVWLSGDAVIWCILIDMTYWLMLYAFVAPFQLTCSGGSCGESPAEISPIYSLWATFIGLYIANYVVERSTG